VEQLELEGIAEAVLHEAGQDDDDVPRLAQLVAAHLGNNAVEYSPIKLRGDGALVRIREDWRIYVRRGLSIERRSFAIAHELAEWWLRVREKYQGEDVEHAANYIAAAILSPRRAFRLALEQFGHDFSELAGAFRVTETHVALREAELARLPRAVVSPALVRVRGPEEWVWPEEEVVRRWARRAPHGLRKVRLSDDPRRVVLDAEARDVG
jgi:Zn-dependent peptidase ImmA (M78 family)